MDFDTIPPLSLLADSSLTEVTAREHDWLFIFSSHVSIVAESHWRLLEGNRVIITDEDHGQLFGHKTPVDATAVVCTELNGAPVVRATFSQVSDLLLSFTNGCTLELLVSSAGYENWHAYGPDESHTFAIGGGELCREAR